MTSSRLLFVFIFSFLFLTSANSQTLTNAGFSNDTLITDAAYQFNYKSGCSGTVTKVKGCAKIIRPGGECGVPGSSSDASVGDAINSGDQIQTCGKSLVEITMSDGSVVTVAPNSSVNLDNAMCEPGNPFSFRLLMGSVWSKVAPYMGGEQNIINTENAVTGVRGTGYLTEVSYDTVFNEGDRNVYNINKTTRVIVLEGTVEVWNTSHATVTDTADQVQLARDYESGRINSEEFVRRITEINNNYKRTVSAGYETTVYNELPPTVPVRTTLNLSAVSDENFINR